MSRLLYQLSYAAIPPQAVIIYANKWLAICQYAMNVSPFPLHKTVFITNSNVDNVPIVFNFIVIVVQ